MKKIKLHKQRGCERRGTETWEGETSNGRQSICFVDYDYEDEEPEAPTVQAPAYTREDEERDMADQARE